MKNLIAAVIALIFPRQPGLYEAYRPDVEPGDPGNFDYDPDYAEQDAAAREGRHS